MSKGNKVDQAVENASKHPWTSGLTATFGAAAFASGGMFTIAAGIASPFLTARETIIGGINLFRERTTLSKAFSAASTATGTAAGIGFASAMNLPGAEGLAGYFMTSAAMIATSTLNVAAHYTRNIGPTLKITSKPKDNDNNTPPAP